MKTISFVIIQHLEKGYTYREFVSPKTIVCFYDNYFFKCKLLIKRTYPNNFENGNFLLRYRKKKTLPHVAYSNRDSILHMHGMRCMKYDQVMDS